MISNVNNILKNKIIHNKKVTNEEINKFIKYMIDKTILITNRMYQTKKDYMNLFSEIALSYNVPYKYTENEKGILIKINNYIYIVDISFKNNNFQDFTKNKYIEYTEENYLKYLELSGDSIE